MNNAQLTGLRQIAEGLTASDGSAGTRIRDAAAELLEACKTVVREYDQENNTRVVPMTPTPAVTAAKTAIAKAEG